MTLTPVRAGIVGTGLMGRWHAHSISKVGGRVIAVSDLHENAACSLASHYPGAVVFAEAEAMLHQVKLDALHICTPLATHYDLTMLALEAGVNAIIEKPLTPDTEETERLYEQADARGLLVCPVHQFIFQDGVLRALVWLPEIGNVTQMQGTFRSAGGVGLTAQQLDAIVADILPHPLALFDVFLRDGLPETDWVAVRAQRGELHAVSDMGGVTAIISISMNARPTATTFEIVGTNGTIHLDLFHGYAFREPGQVSRARKMIHPFDHSARQFSAASLNLAGRALRQEPAYPGLRRLIGSFYEAIRGEGAPPISREAAVAVARGRDKLMKSQRISLPKP